LLPCDNKKKDLTDAAAMPAPMRQILPLAVTLVALRTTGTTLQESKNLQNVIHQFSLRFT